MVTTHQQRIDALDAIVAQYNLNNHPFYQAWRMGQISTDMLADYAAEYGKFIALIDKGWDTLGYPQYAEEEREHVILWSQFQAELNDPTPSNRVQTNVLVEAASSLFSEKASSLGALYSFEAQQPHTSQSKLDGLNEHYQFTEKGKEYFVVHAGEEYEVEDLQKKIAEFSEAEFEQAKSACSVVCSSMWAALDGIYYARQTIEA
jgi:pyrroloquinoline-quinone synthase